MKKKIGIIGGSGLYEIEGVEIIKEIEVETPFGSPSDPIIEAKIDDNNLYFLPRHGKGHRILPTFINYRANIYALKKLGVEWIISVSAVGSMKEEIKPGDIVIVDQFIDRTTKRVSTFFEPPLAVHVGFADPVCPVLKEILYRVAKRKGYKVHNGGTYICIEGPQFSTRAESFSYRAMGVDVIGMTNMPEAKLAREAEICYATIALSTDYDCWHQEEEDVSVESVVQVLKTATKKAKEIIKEAVKELPEKRECLCSTALKDAIITDKRCLDKATIEKYKIFIERYL